MLWEKQTGSREYTIKSVHLYTKYKWPPFWKLCPGVEEYNAEGYKLLSRDEGGLHKPEDLCLLSFSSNEDSVDGFMGDEANFNLCWFLHVSKDCYGFSPLEIMENPTLRSQNIPLPEHWDQKQRARGMSPLHHGLKYFSLKHRVCYSQVAKRPGDSESFYI